MEGRLMYHGNKNIDNNACQEPSQQATFCYTADYGFEYSDDEAQEEDVDIENQYYNSKGDLQSLYVFPDGLFSLLSTSGLSSKGIDRTSLARSLF